MKTMELSRVKAIMIDSEEFDILNEAEKILREVQEAFGNETTIMSLETGEVIQPRELARARAILNFVATYRTVEVS